MPTTITGLPTSVTITTGAEEVLTLPTGTAWLLITDFAADIEVFHAAGGTAMTMPTGAIPVMLPVSGMGYVSIKATSDGTCVVRAVL